MGSLRLVAILLLLGSPAFAQSPTYGLGRTPTAEEIRALDISIGPTGEELPPGRGTAREGALVFVNQGCIVCHGETGVDRPALDDLEHAVLAAQLVAIAADELLVRAAAAEAVDGKIRRRRDDVVLQA